MSIDVDVSERMLLSLDRAVPVGLIVNKLVTNSLKYAFADSGGLIRVGFGGDPDRGEANITVEDDGRGIGKPREGGLGLTLVSAFAKQLGGKVIREDVEKGTRTVVCFPLPSRGWPAKLATSLCVGLEGARMAALGEKTTALE